MSKAPPIMGAIIPPLSVDKRQYKISHRGHQEMETHTRESAEAVPQAVPRTDKDMYEFICRLYKIRSTIYQLTFRGKYLGRPA